MQQSMRQVPVYSYFIDEGPDGIFVTNSNIVGLIYPMPNDDPSGKDDSGDLELSSVIGLSIVLLSSLLV